MTSDLLLFAAFAVGHAAIWTAALSHLYGLPLRRGVLRTGRLLAGAWIVAAPLALLLASRWDVGETLRRAWSEGAGAGLAAYELVCVAFGGVLVPLAALRSRRRRAPAAVAGEAVETLDVTHMLGRKPVGSGKDAWMARLPGNQLFRVEFTRLRLRLPGQPPARAPVPGCWDGLSILHLSDLHFHGTPEREFYEVVLDHCLTLGTPDLVAVTGDFVDSDHHYRWVGPLLGRLRWNVAAFAVLGNHDRWHEPDRLRRCLRRAGLREIGNRWEVVEVPALPLVVVGHEGPWFRPGPDLSDCPAEGFRLCLSHTPDNLPWAQRHGIDLMLAGHVHGGQIRVPGFGSIFVPSRFGRRYDQGTFYEPPTLMHVTRGVAGKTPLRIFCRPQVSWLVLEATG